MYQDSFFKTKTSTLSSSLINLHYYIALKITNPGHLLSSSLLDSAYWTFIFLGSMHVERSLASWILYIVVVDHKFEAGSPKLLSCCLILANLISPSFSAFTT